MAQDKRDWESCGHSIGVAEVRDGAAITIYKFSPKLPWGKTEEWRRIREKSQGFLDVSYCCSHPEVIEISDKLGKKVYGIRGEDSAAVLFSPDLQEDLRVSGCVSDVEKYRKKSNGDIFRKMVDRELMICGVCRHYNPKDPV